MSLSSSGKSLVSGGLSVVKNYELGARKLLQSVKYLQYKHVNLVSCPQGPAKILDVMLVCSYSSVQTGGMIQLPDPQVQLSHELQIQ